ncbi:hypothetical protein IAT38_006080 [Cryptococcus sp. DSM 104549]
MVHSTIPRATPPKVEQAAKFVLHHLDQHRSAWKSRGTQCPPLFVGVQGPQGAGKSHLSGLLPTYLEEEHSLRVTPFSLDDFYLTHTDQVALARSKPDNPLLAGRGPPGTHDLPLLEKAFESLKVINGPRDASAEATLQLPIYDKSLFGGQGDRSPEVLKVEGPVDVVIFEGWMNGFASLGDDELKARVKNASPSLSTIPLYSQNTLEELNRSLREYEGIWGQLDCFIQIRPLDMSYVWTWRLEQEHNMKASNGGIGMTDTEVRQFIDRYMPSYELFQDGIDKKTASWHGNGLRYIVDIKRDIVQVESF